MGVNESATPSGSPAEPFPELWQAAALDRYGSLFAEGPFAPAVPSGEDAVEGELPAVSARSAEPPLVTGTLGRLLEDQGHVQEAAEVYGNVLAGRPTDVELRQRALEASRKQPWPLTAEDLLASAERDALGPAAARRQLLGAYLERLGRRAN